MRTGELLGAEILYFEVLSEDDGPAFRDADVSASGFSNLTLGAARVLPALHAGSGAASTSISALAIGTSGLAGNGSSTASMGALRVVLASTAAAGSSAVNLAARAIAQAAASAAGSSTIAAQTQARKDAAVWAAGSSTVFAPTQVLAYGVVGFEGSSQANIGAVEVFPASLTSGGLATYSTSGLALARTIEATDMERPNEFRSMDRGLGDSSMNVPPDEPMDRPDEHRSMEVTS